MRLDNFIYKKFNMKTDFEGREIEPGDLLLRPYLATFVKCYALRYTKSGKLLISCYKDSSNYVNHWKDLSEHNSQRSPYYNWGSFYILEKNVAIPERLKKFMK